MLRYGVSNLVFDQVNSDIRSKLITSAQVCDFAPTALYGNWDSMPDMLSSRPYYGASMEVCALQSLFFQMQGASLIQDPQGYEIIEYQVIKLARAAQQSGAKCLIFGAPGTRKHATPRLEMSEIHSRIKSLADICFSAGVLLCFEVNSPKFGCEFLVSNAELFELLSRLNHPGLGLHLDLGQMSEAGDDLTGLLSCTNFQLNHLHLSGPDFTLSPERMPHYLDVIAELKRLGKPVDVILEVQHLSESEGALLISMSEELAKACLT